MADKKINIILTSYPNGKCTPTKLKLGPWIDKQKQEFLQLVRDPGLLGDGCCFNVHFDKFILHSCGSKKPITFTPMHSQNKKNEIIIEIIPDEENRTCWPACPETCPLCIQDGQCTSQLVSRCIGEFLFKDKYKQR